MGLLDTQKSSNPMWSDKILDHIETTDVKKMTVNGTIGKTGLLLAITVITAFCSWQFMFSMGTALYGVMFATMIGAGILLYATYKNPNIGHWSAPLYAVLEGMLVGVITAIFASAYEGIVVTAVLLTFGIMALMLFLYTARIIKVTQKFRAVMGVGLAAIGILYLTSWILGMFGVSIPFMQGGGLLAVGINVVIAGFAAFTFLLDFDMIESHVKRGAPKAMEWVGSMALLATIVWLYIEIIKLLARLQSD